MKSRLQITNIKKLFSKKFIVLVTAMVVVGSTSLLIFNYFQTQKELEEYKTYSDIQAIKEKNEILKKVRSLVVLPENEEPTLATVSDANALKDQKFFANAQNGDKVLIFQKAGRAVLYRPQIQKIIEASPISISGTVSGISDNMPTPESTPSTDIKPETEIPPAKVAIHNGTLTSGLASRLADVLQEKYSSDKIEVKELNNAQQLFDNTIIVDITNKYTDIKYDLTKTLGAKEENVDGIQNIPNVDILIIIGKDFSITKLQ